jgi:hypothetical protein
MELNLQNIEELIFYDKKVQRLLPEFRHLFDQWRLGKQVPGMQAIGKRSVFDLLNGLEPYHVQKLEEYFAAKIILDKIDYSIIVHYEGGLEEPAELCRYSNFKEFCVYRDADNFYISFWR